MLFRFLLMIADLVLDCVHGCCGVGGLLFVVDVCDCGCGAFAGVGCVGKGFLVAFVLLLL